MLFGELVGGLFELGVCDADLPISFADPAFAGFACLVLFTYLELQRVSFIDNIRGFGVWCVVNFAFQQIRLPSAVG